MSTRSSFGPIRPTTCSSFSLSATFDRLGEVVFEIGRHAEALGAFEKALELMKLWLDCGTSSTTTSSTTWLTPTSRLGALSKLSAEVVELERRGEEVPKMAPMASSREGAPPPKKPTDGAFPTSDESR